MRVRFTYFPGMFSLGLLLAISACSRVELPSVPPILPYQPSPFLSRGSEHDHSLVIAIPENKPPYFNGATNDGIERDILQEAFALVGKHPDFMETADRKKKYDATRFNIECVSSISEEYRLDSASYFSDQVVSYHYKLFTLRKKNMVIRDYSDLAGKTVEAFSSGTRYLGKHFTEVIPKMSAYAEHVNRFSQVALLLLGRVDVLVIDRDMFHFISSNLLTTRPESYDGDVVESQLEKAVDLKIACHNKETVDYFNKGLAMLRSSHRYEEIFRHYLHN
ncbi:putative PBPb domain-containing protein [Gammaproteobacteria bacterium]